MIKYLFISFVFYVRLRTVWRLTQISTLSNFSAFFFFSFIKIYTINWYEILLSVFHFYFLENIFFCIFPFSSFPGSLALSRLHCYSLSLVAAWNLLDWDSWYSSWLLHSEFFPSYLQKQLSIILNVSAQKWIHLLFPSPQLRLNFVSFLKFFF